MSRKAERSLESGDASWTKPSEPARGAAWKAFVPLIVTGALAAGAWHASGAYFMKKSQQRAADQWDQFRVCLLGDALMPGDRPSERVRFIQLANHTSDEDKTWPGRCEPYAKSLDEALSARAIVAQLGPMPNATKIVKGTEDPAMRSDLDLLFEELEMADLPLPKHGHVVEPAPAPAKPVFQRDDLHQVGKVLDLASIHASFDPSTGEHLRLLLPETQPQTCHLNDGAPDKRWTSLVCTNSPLSVSPEARLGLAPTEKGGTDLIVVRDSGKTDGIYDAATGLMVLQPRYFDTQTHVESDGRATIVYAKLRGDSSMERVEHFRILQSTPGKRPEPRRLKVPKTARLLLLPSHLLWWEKGDKKKGDDLVAQPFTGKRKPLGKREVIANLPYGSRFLSRCADGDQQAYLFGAGMKDRRYTLLIKTPKGFAPAHDVGTIAGRVTMSCHGDKAVLQRIQHNRVSRWLCDEETCLLGLSDKLPVLESKVQVVTSLGEKVAVAWKDEAGALRIRVAAPDMLAATRDTVLFDDWHNGGVEMTDVKAVAGGGLGVMVAQDVGRRVYAFRVEPSGAVTPIEISR